MPRCAKAILPLVSLLLFPLTAYAQASIVGTVRDASGAVLPGVTVEASSPALIEKTRTVITNTAGQYSIEDLRPGTYSVTFALPGFSTSKRDGIELSGQFIATVNGDMKVGGVQETVTVSGEAPVVDVTSSRTQETISGETVSEIPTSRLYSSLTQLVPALNVQGNDVGGSQGNVFSVFQIHGGRRNEGQVLVDGMSGGYQGMGVSGYAPEVGNAQEIVFNLSGGLGEATTGGPQLNIIGKQGGNMFSGSFFVNGSGSAFVNDNLSPELKAKGLSTPLKPKKLYDINPAFGGPIKRDSLWFFATFRYQRNLQTVASLWDNKNAGDNTKWTYAPDFDKQSIDDGEWRNHSVRLTWQMTPRNKIVGWSDLHYNCLHCDNGGSSSGLTFTGLVATKEALGRNENHPSSLTQVSWTSPHTNRLLFDANVQIGPNFWWGARQKNSFDTTTIPVQDDGLTISTPNGPVTYTGLNYRSANWSGHTGFTYVGQGAVSYVTGTHSAKFGARFHENDSTFPKNFYNNAQLKYNFRGGVPYQLTMYGDQASDQHQRQRLFALYAQDRWTLNRLSLQGGLRFEHLADHFAAQQIGPNIFIPTAVTFPDQDGPLNQKDLQPRFGASYDVFGNGKTGAKFFLGRYVTTFNTVDEWLNYSPAGNAHFVTQTNRPWTDGNGNFVADCNLLNPVANGECGAMSNPNFGKTVNQLTLDPDTTSGWNKREYSWDLTTGVTQQIAPRVSVEVDYIRRTWGNLKTNINRALTPADFDTFVYNVPQDPRLPDGGGYALTFRDVKPAKFGIYDNFQTFTKNVGGSSNSYNGVDFNANVRLRNVTMQGGTSTGNVVEDECGVVAQHPEIYISGLGWGGALDFFKQFNPSLGQWPQSFCHRESGWLTNIKGLASYTVPKVDVLLSGTWHSVPYPGNNFPSVTSQSLGGQVLAVPIAETNLGRPLASGLPIEFLNIVKPGTLNYDRLSQADVRLGKNLRYGRTKTLVALDIFNIFNSNTPDVYQTTYSPPSPTSTYLNPTSITVGRFFKISAQLDF
jgi:Carboxypeptidase regulatory-like domain